MAICWDHLTPLILNIFNIFNGGIQKGLSAGNLDSQESLEILRDYTPKVINYKINKEIYYLITYVPLTVHTDKRVFDRDLINGKIQEKGNLNENFCYYLTGLIEGDGTIIVPKTARSAVGRINYPSIQISFDSRDIPLAIMIQKELGFGSLNKTKGVNAYRQCINNYEGLIKKIIKLGSKFKTVKINDFNRQIIFKNERLNWNFPVSHQNNTEFIDNPWLAGFIDADGYFYVNKKSGNGFEQVQAKKDHNNLSKKDIKLKLAGFLNVPLKETSKAYCNSQAQYRVRTNQLSNNLLLINYLDTWQLKSSKYLNYKDFSYVTNQRLNKTHLTPENKEQILSISKNKNNQRTLFNWDHLKKFYNINN